ncbi:glycosyltransferase family 2 protein [Nocardia sp. NPDC005998]|uniref:glycosyltransferase family 2 protein n=1 Tax=Nocardia sp. NPDC005998 TaxID=3156894 RepID=UPI0033B44C88
MTGTPSLITLSVVIPVLDEAALILQCLDRLVDQEAISEIIVVDNGSTDGTDAIVREYAAAHPKVELVYEETRGLIPARNTGLAKARGDFIARIDADTFVEPYWGAAIRDYASAHPDVAATTGIFTYHDSPVPFFLDIGVWAKLKLGMFGGPVGNMHGANMAIRRTAWDEVKGDTTTRTDIHEDLDLALCLSIKELRIQQLPDQRVRISARRRRTNPREFWTYQLRGLDALTNRGYTLLPVTRVYASLAWLGHTLQWPIYRLWDFDRRRFTLRGSPERLSPVD